MRRLRVFTGAMVLALFAGCGSSEPTGPSQPVVASVQVTLPQATLQVGGSTQATAQVATSSGEPVPGRTVTWVSSNPAVASVSSTGAVAALAVGSTEIRATSDGITGVRVLTVVPVPVASVDVSAPVTSLVAPGTAQFTATPRAANGTALGDRTVTWSSGAPGVATVSSTGLVTAIAPGTVTITATSEGVTGTRVLTVLPPPVAVVEVTAPTAVLAINGSTQAVATLRAADGSVLTGRAITWASGAPTVAVVSADGVVTAVAPGTATITATSEGRSGALVVTVQPPTVATIIVSPGSLSLAPGQSRDLVATVLDAQGNNMPDRTVSWGTSNPAVVTVLPNGRITAQGPGTATISAVVGTKIGTAVVTVTAASVASVTLNFPSVSLTEGDTRVLIATARDANGNVLRGRDVQWTSTNLNVVNGWVFADTAVITGLTGGSAIVTATVEGRSASVPVTVTATTTSVCSAIAGASLYGHDGQFLGTFTHGSNYNSVKNTSGPYGSTYSWTSTNNPVGNYGSAYSLLSARNPYTITPPRIVRNGTVLAYYTTNSILTPRVSPAYALTCAFP